MSDKPDALRTLRPRSSRTPSTPRKVLRKSFASVEEFAGSTHATFEASFSQKTNLFNASVDRVNALNEDIDRNRKRNEKSSLVEYAGSSDDEDSPWQNGKFKPAAEIVSYYRQLGDWWNVLPKTDVTYDETSKWYRKEIAPGIPVIPNLARPPLHPVKETVSHFSLFSRNTGAVYNGSSSNGKSYFFNSSSQFATASTSQLEEKSLISKFISILLKFVCFPYNVVFGGFHRSKHPITGRNASNASVAAWWRAPFLWIYRVMMLLFTWEILILTSTRQAFNKIDSKLALKMFSLLSIIVLSISAYLYYGFDYKSITIPTISMTDFQNFTNWDYSGAIEMLKPLNMSWAYENYANMPNIGWVYEQ